MGVSAKQGKVGDSKKRTPSVRSQSPKQMGERPGGAGLAVGGHLEEGRSGQATLERRES